MAGGGAEAGGLRVAAGGGAGQPVLLLLHGMGATGDVWRGWAGLLAEHWPGRWLAPDLPGHGGSAPLDRYSFDSFAANLAGLFAPGDRVVVLGHSLGGAVGLALAGQASAKPAGQVSAEPAGRGPVSAEPGGTGPGWAVEAVVGLGVKVGWTSDELGRAVALAARPVGWYDSRAEAAQRHLRVSGLVGIVEPDDPVVDGGILASGGGRWRLAMDPRAFGVGAPEMAGLLSAASVPVLLARGEHDPMVGADELARLGVPSHTLSGLGHNAHVEDPAAVLALLEGFHDVRS
ncbi:alpha/beta hydrolase [Micromonospora sp. WMMD1102]|uniref:alpha/beta fold hydrolase n=1 Tax=Micromonospora sp. WMMD1102 TaxID=3016105 RepID=UPI0024152B15|nr:alpha/beta hydrolase [Micromonospora sp. WMMD1102]MDG4790642.1 alpha/beta hydrolase [Micromonospora sp. WMMD1102]